MSRRVQVLRPSKCQHMPIEFTPLFLGADLSWFKKAWPLTAVVLVAGYAGAIYSGFVQPIGATWIACLTLLVWMCGRTPVGSFGVVLHAICFAVALLLSLHRLPGFRNPVLMGPISFTPDAIPFKLYLNFDKSAVGFALILLYAPLCRTRGVRRTFTVGMSGIVLALLITLPPALLFGAVRWEPKYPQDLWLWALANLLLVAFAEEALFRGFLQETLSRWFNDIRGSSEVAIGAAATAFGAFHYASGPSMILLASIAGLAYWFAYNRGGLLASVLADFCLNLCHILLFTYPLLAAG